MKSKKSKKKKKIKGKGIYQDIANQYRNLFCNGRARKLYDGEFHPFCANYMGPGTRIDLKDVQYYPPFGCSDNIARTHDLDYLEAFKLPSEEKKKKIREADDKFLKNIEKCKNDFPYYEIGKTGIETKEFLEKNSPINLLGNYQGGCLNCILNGGCKECGGKNKGGCLSCGKVNSYLTNL